MSAIPYDSPEEGWDGYEDDETTELPGRPRRQFWTRGSAALIALLLGAIGFYAGIRVEKGQVSSSSSTSNPLAALAAARGGSSRTGASSFAGRGGFAAAFGGGNSTFGTVSSVDGNTLYVTETSTGNVVKVELSSATKLTKSVDVGKSSVHPGDTLVIQGVKGSNGTISATTVTDSGAAASGAGAATGGAGTGSGSGGSGSAVSSLFSGGG
jgi:hypothetical protein